VKCSSGIKEIGVGTGYISIKIKKKLPYYKKGRAVA
jgi:hypothetical protein